MVAIAAPRINACDSCSSEEAIKPNFPRWIITAAVGKLHRRLETETRGAHVSSPRRQAKREALWILLLYTSGCCCCCHATCCFSSQNYPEEDISFIKLTQDQVICVFCFPPILCSANLTSSASFSNWSSWRIKGSFKQCEVIAGL